MILTLLQMTFIVACGAGWRLLTPGGLSAEQTRPILTTVVYYLFLPALILDVLWKAEIGIQSLAYTLLGSSCILLALLITWLLTKLFRFTNKKTGALLLASAFPNVTYLGLPVLEQAFGSWARSVAIQIDLFASAPLLFTVGVILARHYGEQQQTTEKRFAFLTTPPFLAAFVAVILSINEVVMPIWFAGVLKQLSAAVVPIMLFSLGLALSWRALKIALLPAILLVIGIKLLLMPLLAIEIIPYLNLDAEHKKAAVMDIAMPSMVLGIVFCDRYQLDSGLYAMAVTVTTLLSMLSLPFWYAFL